MGSNNPIGSTAMTDLFFNAGNLDKALNSSSDMWRDRFGIERVTYSYMERNVTELINNISGPTGATKVGYKNPAPGGITKNIAQRLMAFLSTTDFDTPQNTILAALSSSAAVLDLEESFTIEVGPAVQFKTITAAIHQLVKMRPLFKNGQAKCKIKLLSGFVMAEQILVINGSDLNWIIIESDVPVRIDHTKITTKLSDEDDLIPIFGASNQSVLPSIKALFYYDSNTTSKDGVAVIEAAGVYLYPGSGVQKSRNGFKALYGGWGFCYMRGLVLSGGGGGAGNTTGVDFSNARNRGLHVAHGSVVGFPRSNFANSLGDYGVYCIWNSMADLYQSDASGAAGTAFCSRDGSIVNCRESCAARSKRGYHALHGGRINARSKQTPEAAMWVKDSARGCSEYGIIASGCSQIEGAEVDVSGCTGQAGVIASDSSSVSFQLGIANGCADKGIFASGAAHIQADGADASTNPIGMYAIGVATIAAQSASKQAKINDCGFGALVAGGGRIDATGIQALRCDRAVEARDTGSIDARGANLSSSKQRGVSCIDGGTVNVIDGIITDSLDRAITCRDGGRVSARGANCDRAGYLSVEVKAGGIVSFHSGIGDKLNVAINTVTTDGIIFK
ncbi:putative head-binding domain-containing protein [Aeromonas phage ZPAH34]|uniref:tail fiber protein n=1 Tax=Aeromonas phage ZPAH34 TaxID=2924888 RepID=UPI0023293BA3|nr:tail fiber protein [Aeromonas phage ZPAH34]UOX39546.1 putative head-binding domain-containing protein [Aeromonas phage ZPAH34]